MWTLQNREEAVIVEMASNPVNKQNDDFLRDLHRAFDQLDQEYPGKPVILTAQGKCFSAGLDFEAVFPMFARGSQKEVADWFAEYQRSMMRIFTSPRLTIAAVNGHAFAGGLILALACDFRLAAEGGSKFSLNEVAIGIPMPSVYIELLRYRLGAAAIETTLLARTYDLADAKRLGFIQEVVPPEQLLEAALAVARPISADCRPGYAHSKRAFLYPVLDAIDTYSEELEKETFRLMTAEAAVRQQQATLRKLKEKR